MTDRVEDWPDAEIVRFLAVEGMGWILDISGWYWLAPGKGTRCRNSSWNPLTDANDLLGKYGLVEVMREMGWTVITMRLGGNKAHNTCHLSYRNKAGENKNLSGQQVAVTIQRAICLACIKALMALKENSND